jgi:glycosyltransferase involved in cell wall biosynthesis
LEWPVEAYRQTGFPLKIVGTGSEFRKLKRHAGPNTEFLGWQTDEAILELYRGCRFLVFPGEEDFGIVPVEAQACGKPVIAWGRGGLLEIVVEGETGQFFRRPTVESLIEAVETAASRDWDPEAIRRNALRFTTQRFLDGLDDSIQKCLRQK